MLNYEITREGIESLPQTQISNVIYLCNMIMYTFDNSRVFGKNSIPFKIKTFHIKVQTSKCSRRLKT